MLTFSPRASRLRALLGSLLVMVLVTTGCGVFGEPEASCAAPTLTVQPSKAAPGEEFLLRGAAFAQAGCEKPAKPNPGVRVVFRQGPKAWDLATVDVGRDSLFKVRLRVPNGAKPGRAVLSVDGGSKMAEKRFVVTD